jgi:hypothetical protein
VALHRGSQPSADASEYLSNVVIMMTKTSNNDVVRLMNDFFLDILMKENDALY